MPTASHKPWTRTLQFARGQRKEPVWKNADCGIVCEIVSLMAASFAAKGESDRTWSTLFVSKQGLLSRSMAARTICRAEGTRMQFVSGGSSVKATGYCDSLPWNHTTISTVS